MQLQAIRVAIRAIVAIAICLALFDVGSSSVHQKALALSTTPSRPPLSLTALDERIATPVRKGGEQVIDLTGFTIDLRAASVRSEKAGTSARSSMSADQFYQHLQKGLNSAQPVGLDLSNTLIQGDLNLSRLSLRMLAYSGTTLPTLEAFNQSVKSLGKASGRTAVSPKEVLARTFLIQPQNVQLDTFVFQGPLLLNQTCFDGALNAADLYFLGAVEANRAIFTQMARWHGAKFAKSADFSQGQFQQDSSFRSALFASRARFQQSSFAGKASWQGVDFQGSLAGGVSFAQADFHSASFARSHWQMDADFDQAIFHEAVSFQKSRFDRSLLLTNAQLEAAANFRQVQFQRSVSLRGARVLSQVDFGDALFADGVTINVADLDFNAGEAKVLGSPGQIGQVFSVPTLSGNETVLRNLVRNFRLLEQVSDANQLEYTTERLRLSQIRRQIFGVSLNQARPNQLLKLGFNADQVAAVINRVHEAALNENRPFVSPSDLLEVDQIDLATYLRVRDRITTEPTTLLSRSQWLIRWLLLSGLLLLSDYGTSVGLVFSVGLVATTLFGTMFWGIDRIRRWVPTPVLPVLSEVTWMGLSSGLVLLLSTSVLYQCSAYPLRTLLAIGVVVLPVPAILVTRLYQQGRYHDLMNSSYFVKNGALRKLQVLIARLPIIPQFPFYRERYLPLLMDRQWSWLNYYDFSLNNWFKFGFSDIRLRDREVPSIVSALVWYQWSLGTAYIALLLWTLSRTIPGLNLLLYF